jgi:hypothetical protein
MRIRPTLLAAVAVLALLTGCQAPAFAAPSLPTAAQVAGMLLTAEDMPDGFTTTAAAADQSDPDSVVQGCGATTAVPNVSGAAVFNRGWTTFIAEGLRVSTPADAGRAIRALNDGNCTGMTMERLAFPALGDESAAFRAPGMGVTTHVIGIRHRDTLIILTHTVLGEPGIATTEAVARAALARVVANR